MKKLTFGVLKGHTPKFKPKDKVWVIEDRRVVETTVRSIKFELFRGETSLACSGYGLDLFPFGKRPESYYEYQLYATKEQADRHAVWHAVNGVSAESWLAAIGNRKDQNTLDGCELQPCCADISRMRDLLLLCKARKGLIERDVSEIKSIWKGHKLDRRHKWPNLATILLKLGVLKQTKTKTAAS